MPQLVACTETCLTPKKMKQLKLTYSDNYTSCDIIGKGSTCTVCKCIRKSDKKEFAVKIICKKSLDEHSMKYIKREISVLKKLKNTKGVIHMEDVYENDKYIYIILELCNGNDLHDYIVNSKSIDERHIAYIFYQICVTVHKCHKKRIIHRDLKPENIFLKNNNNLSLKLSDFGLSYYFHKNHQGIKKMSTKCGSPTFVAPEIISNKYYTGNCDWWSCGVILYTLLSGTYPFYDSSASKVYEKIKNIQYSFPSAVWKNISDEAKDLISKLLVKDVNKRFNYRKIMQHPFMSKNLVFSH